MNNNEEIDLDDIFDKDNIFKPLTEGLGFHHSLKDSTEIKSDLSKKSLMLKEQLESRAKEIHSKTLEIEKTNMGELAPFYATQKDLGTPIELFESKNDITVEEPFMGIRLLAWIIDAIIVVSFITLIFSSVILIGNIPLGFIRDNMLSADFIITVLLMTSLIYTFYFTFFDKTKFSTPGKRIMGLKVVNLDGEGISLKQSFIRAVLTLISIFVLGMSSLFKFHDKLTDTRVLNS
jgi:uncharacterized RDD family membrane protein YckC